uniref:AAA family ATPase n=1 Tax=Enterococcus casseliflavus TaxID=37734 RepID=UPI001CD78977
MVEVLLMCGVSGAGKTTYSKQKEQEGYVRLAIDELIWEDYGVYGVDYPGMATVFLTNFIRCRTSFRMLFRLSLTMSLLGCDDLRQELTVK